MSLYFDLDTYYWPFIVNGQNNQIVFTENSNTQTITLDSGVYWAVNSSPTGTIVEGSSLYQHLKNKIESAFNEDYQFKELSLSTPGDYYGIQLEQTTANTSFELNFDDQAFTLSPRYFGFLEGASNKQSSNHIIEGDYSQWGCVSLPKPPSDLSYEPRVQNFSSRPGPGGYHNRWTPEHGVRLLKYHQIPAVHIFPQKANNPTLSSDASWIRGDINNGLLDMYRRMTIDDVVVNFQEAPDLSDRLTISSTGEVEQLEPLDTLPPFRDFLGRKYEYKGEQYDIEMRFLRKVNDTFTGLDENG